MFIVEHLEPLSEWVLLEYTHISKVWDKQVLFTNVKNEKERAVLNGLGKAVSESITEMTGDIIVMDLKGKTPFKTEDVVKDTMLVIGGICGNFKPTGRTWEQITSKLKNARVRHLGQKHLTTDTAAIAVKLITDGKKLEELSFTEGIEIEIEENVRVELPYGYLIKNGEPILTPGLIELLTEELLMEDSNKELEKVSK